MQRIWILQAADLSGQTIQLEGFVHHRRDHGKLIFVDLRDRSGFMQLVFREEIAAEAYQNAKTLSSESVIRVQGEVVNRSPETVNPLAPTGKVEVQVTNLTIISLAKGLPFEVNQEANLPGEEVRLKYRYLDMRRLAVLEKLRIRSEMTHRFRSFLHDRDFIDVETPMLTKSTPEGARDFIVPSRLNKGKFYALPQSPQQYKQLLMVGGVERYYQVARCTRDEDLRADRGFEFTQLDLEMAFVNQLDVMALIEEMVIDVVQKIGTKSIRQKPFPVYTEKEARAQFGDDKFDLRADPKNPDELAFAWVVDFPTFIRDEESKGWTYSHNPFTGPKPELNQVLQSIDLDRLNEQSEIDKILSLTSTQYDLVCNGYEVGGGGIRIHNAALLTKVFQIIGHTPDKIKEQFGHMLEAFTYGVPPHGGIALGLDRLAMLLCGETSLKEVMPFPMTSTGKTAVMDAPSEVSEAQLIDVGLSLRGKGKRDVYADLTAMLESRHVTYKTFEHEAVRTSEEAAQVRGTELASGAKAMLIKGGDTFVLCVPADRKVDSAKLRALLKVSKTRFAMPEEVVKLTQCEPGGVPPFGNLFGLRTLIDATLKQNTEINFNAGLRTKSIALNYEDFERSAGGEIVDIVGA